MNWYPDHDGSRQPYTYGMAIANLVTGRPLSWGFLAFVAACGSSSAASTQTDASLDQYEAAVQHEAAVQYGDAIQVADAVRDGSDEKSPSDDGGGASSPDGAASADATTQPSDASTNEGGSSSAHCTGPADCRTFSDYCGGCACDALVVSEPDPICEAGTVQCLVDPCSGHSAACDTTGHCVLR